MCFFKRYKIKRLEKKLKPFHAAREHNTPSTLAVQKEQKLWHKLANIYLKLHGNKKYPFAIEEAMTCYRVAAFLDDPKAQFILGKHFIDEARLREALEARLIYSSPGNQRRIQQLYEEGIAYLKAGSALNDAPSKRLLGLCQINGWGMPANRDQGFELVVASIELEHAWDRIPQIFSQIGLNKPEFFTAIMQRKDRSS